MKLRPRSKLVLAAALGLALSGLSAQAQLITNLKGTATFDTFVGGSNNSVTPNGQVNTIEVIKTGTPTATPFSITFDSTLGQGVQNVTLNGGTLTTSNITFSSTFQNLSYFSSVAMHLDYDFDGNGSIDVHQNYTINLSSFTTPNGLTGVSYAIVPLNDFGSVTINGAQYGFASTVSGATGTLFDNKSIAAQIQFQFIATPVPEPSTYALAGVVALAGIVLYRRRQASAGMSEMSV